MDVSPANIKGFLNDKIYLITTAALSVGVSWILWRKFKKKPKRICGVDYPRETVIVHYGGVALKGKHAPFLGHFVMKLVTYLKITGIPFQVCDQRIPSPKGKVPWMEYNGVTMGDSQLIINFLNKEFNVDLNKNMTDRERAVAWGIQKWLEEFTYWLNVQIRWVLLIDQFVAGDYLGIFWRKRFMKLLMRRKAGKMLYAVGIGRHEAQEVFDMMKHDLKQLSIILGDKPYLLGNEPTQVDCSAFGILSQICYETPDICQGKQFLNTSEVFSSDRPDEFRLMYEVSFPGHGKPLVVMITDELKNLREYIERIKEKHWPDWNEYLLKE